MCFGLGQFQVGNKVEVKFTGYITAIEVIDNVIIYRVQESKEAQKINPTAYNLTYPMLKKID